jgi:hypothetical protein
MKNLSILIKLKEEKRNLWDKHCWSGRWFNEEEEKLDNELRKQINEIQSKGVYCKCSECGIENETVDFTSETPYRMVCDSCWDEIRDYIKDKCGLI